MAGTGRHGYSTASRMPQSDTLVRRVSRSSVSDPGGSLGHQRCARGHEWAFLMIGGPAISRDVRWEAHRGRSEGRSGLR